MHIDAFRKISLAIIWPVFAFILLFAVWMLKEHFIQPDFSNAVLYPKTTRPLQTFHLFDFDNKPFDKSRLEGKWTFVFFGYTHCPDVCPLTLHTLNQVADLIDKQTDDIQYVFVSVDPERDSDTQLKNYITYFNPGFLGVSGKSDQLIAFSKAIGVSYGKNMLRDDAEFYAMSHSAEIFLISPKAERYAMLPQPHRAHDIVQDFYNIRAHFEQGI